MTLTGERKVSVESMKSFSGIGMPSFRTHGYVCERIAIRENRIMGASRTMICRVVMRDTRLLLLIYLTILSIQVTLIN